MVWKRASGALGGAGRGAEYAEARCEHAGRHDQVGKDEAGHAEGQDDGRARVRVQRRVDDLLRLPDLGREACGAALLVVGDGLLGLLQAGTGDQERSVRARVSA